MRKRFELVDPYLILGAVLALALGAGCGAKPPSLPAAVNVATNDVNAGAAKVLYVLQDAGNLLNQASIAEGKAAQAGLFSAARHQSNVASFKAVAAKGLAAVADVKKGAASWADLKAKVDPFLASIQDVVNNTAADAQGDTGWKAILETAFGVAIQIIGIVAHSSSATGGGL